MTEAEWLASNDPAAMLQLLLSKFAMSDDRKLRLFACGCLTLRGVTPVDIIDGYEQARLWVSDSCRGKPSQTQKAALLREIIGNPFRPVTLPHGKRSRCPAKCVVPHGSVGHPFSQYESAGPESRWAVCETCRGAGKLFAPCPWLTPTVLTLARAAYDERGRRCGECVGGKRIESGTTWAPFDCPACHGTGRIGDGTLDPLTLLAVADALEEAGCVLGCVHCVGGVWGEYDDDARTPILCASPGCALLLHLRSSGPHVRGCWALDLILGKS